MSAHFKTWRDTLLMNTLKTIRHASKLLWYGFLNILIKLWFLFVFILLIILLPILIFLPHKIMINFGQITTDIALKILWVIWRVIKTSLLILLALIIFLLGPILWPVYLGILVLFPRFAAYIMSIKIF